MTMGSYPKRANSEGNPGRTDHRGFYNSPLRVQRTNAAKEILNRELNPKGINVEQVMVRYFRYSNEIQKNIEEKEAERPACFQESTEARGCYGRGHHHENNPGGERP